MSYASAAQVTPSSPAVSRIGRFYITRELGRGTVGCVYLGHDPVIGRDIAIKTYNPRLTPVERSRHEQQFINEARATGLLSHPHIVTVYDACIENGTTYIAMEYLRGRELDKILDSGHRYKPDEVASIVWKIADALNHAHQRQVIHRDIKPANIFMVSDDQPKLVDFGIARAPNRVADKNAHPDDPVTLLIGRRLLGTPNYMSPEQATGRPVDARTDIYSLGAVMYEMLVGRKPFHSEKAEKLLQQIAYKAPPAPHELDARIPTALSQIVMKAMSKRPEKRYETAERMALDIKRYLVRQRRARRRMTIPVPALDQRDPQFLPRERSALFWTGCVSLAVAGAIGAVMLLR
jgi:eukaryotic-like serine/threonine-protein kinase